MKDLINSIIDNFNYTAPIEVVIKNIYKSKGRKDEQISNSKLIISEEDSSLIEVDIIIDIPTNL
ncbi:hypothetical protein ACJDU8_07040 [Clostridium sp. WILCCON 0269]|uniref:Uncharacterized protein n=1 Tax=Candidatus Clostridium eludens TaxID=3381663 RepID=A0ABW8SH47_9CLOT